MTICCYIDVRHVRGDGSRKVVLSRDRVRIAVLRVKKMRMGCKLVKLVKNGVYNF